MKTEDFTIVKLENGNYVVKAKGIYQDIDFVNGGFIATQKRAEEIRDLLIEQMNAPVVHVPTNEEKIAQLEQALAESTAMLELQERRNIQNEQSIAELTTMIAGGNA